MGQCCYCCLSEDDKIDRLFDKIEKCTEISKLEPGGSKPVLVNGKVEVFTTTLVGPITKKTCVYYQVKCEREVKVITSSQNENGDKEWHERYEWEHVYTNEQKVDFQFTDDNAPTLKLVVEAFSNNVSVVRIIFSITSFSFFRLSNECLFTNSFSILCKTVTRRAMRGVPPSQRLWVLLYPS